LDDIVYFVNFITKRVYIIAYKPKNSFYHDITLLVYAGTHCYTLLLADCI